MPPIVGRPRASYRTGGDGISDTLARTSGVSLTTDLMYLHHHSSRPGSAPMTRAPRPDFLVIGAPKAGTTALHAALAQHPDVFVSLAQGAEVLALRRRAAARLVRPRRQALAAGVDLARRPTTPRSSSRPASDQVRGESTPFYLWSRGAHRRIAEALPDVRLIAVVRDPIDRAYSNWMHLWSDGLEPESRLRDRLRAARTSGSRAGWAPFWRYRELGLYGEQLAHLYRYVDPERVLVVRYRDLVDEPRRGRRPGLPVPRHPRGAGRLDPARQLAQLRASPAGGPGCSARSSAPGARLGPVRAARGLAAAPARRSSPCSATAATPHRPRLDADAAAAAPGRVRRRHRPAQPAHRRGLRRLALDRRAAAPTPQRAGDGHADQRTQVTRSCAPSGRAAST